MGKMKELYTTAQETQINLAKDAPLSDRDVLDALWTIRRLTGTPDGMHQIWEVASATTDRLLVRMAKNALVQARKTLAA